MEIPEDKAKSIVEAIVQDLNRRFGFKLYVTDKQVDYSPMLMTVNVCFRDEYDNREWCFATATALSHPEHLYLQLLQNIIARPKRCYLNYSIEKSIDISKLYGNTLEEVCIFFDFNS